MSIEEQLKNLTKDVAEFSLCGLTLKGKVVECYDADTCKIILPIKDGFYKFTCRLSGIDTPEMKPRKAKQNRDNEIVWAKKARGELLRLICQNNAFENLDIKKEEIIHELEKNKNLITVKCLEFDKYGRLLVELYADLQTNSFNKILVNKNLAVIYDGGKKINHWTN